MNAEDLQQLLISNDHSRQVSRMSRSLYQTQGLHNEVKFLGLMNPSVTAEATAVRFLIEVVWKHVERKRNRESGTECMKQEHSSNTNSNI